jgi:endothelin-converting enzyme/putative endopeptidase
MRFPLILGVSALALLGGMTTACSPAPAKPVAEATPTPAAPTTPAFGKFGIDTTAMNTALKPGDDFYGYVNGTWTASYKMPADKTRTGVFDMLGDKSEADVHALLDALPKDAQAGTVAQKVGDLYNGWMDEAAIEARGITPIKADIDKIAAAKTKTDIETLMGEPDYAGPVGLYVQVDPADTTKYNVGVTQSGLGMPDRDYYLKAGPQFDKYRAGYKAYLETIFKLIGDAEPAKSAATVYDLEMKIAKTHWTREQSRNVQATNNPVDRAGLKKMLPAVDWDLMLAPGGLGSQQSFVVNEKSALEASTKLLASESVDAWKKYLTFHIASSHAGQLPKAFDEASFAFFNKTLRGQEVQRERWKRGVSLVNGTMGEGAGELYVAKYFPPANKAKMEEIVANLRKAMGERLKANTWMDEKTRAEALKKLGTFDPRIGYPATFRDYSKLTIEKGKLLENVRAARRFEWDRQVARLGQKVDRTEWGMSPQTVNAYYDPPMNQITFPAAILQPPFFDPNADLAVNYGAIGAVIGHEMGHGFDDQGREFDETGKIRNWWTPETNAKFKASTAKLAAQYNAFCPIQGTCVNGNLTMGENLGDLGGLEMAYTAYHLALDGKEAPVIDGFTGDQRFFLAHSQVWRSIQRDDDLRARVLTDPHAPAPARGSIPERNLDAWYAAFGVKEGDKQYLAPDQRVHLW